jgi:hypothetical protein
MAEYDDDQVQRRRTIAAFIWNTLTVLVLLSTLCLVVVFASIFINPNSSLNLFPPPTLPPAAEMPTITPTPLVILPPTWTLSPTIEPTSTFTPLPTLTPTPTVTPFVLVSPTFTPSPSKAPAGGFAFVVQGNGPVAIVNIAHPELGCNWLGVAGNVVDMSGAPVTQLIVTLGGTINGKPVHSSGVMTSLTGLFRQYGEAGFEFVLGDKPVASKGTLWVQLGDQAGLVLSEKVYFDTFNDCEKNLILINFKQVRQ